MDSPVLKQFKGQGRMEYGAEKIRPTREKKGENNVSYRE